MTRTPSGKTKVVIAIVAVIGSITVAYFKFRAPKPEKPQNSVILKTGGSQSPAVATGNASPVTISYGTPPSKDTTKKESK